MILKLSAHRAGLPGHPVASSMRANEISFFIGPLDPLVPSTHWVSQTRLQGGACGARTGQDKGNEDIIPGSREFRRWGTIKKISPIRQ